MSSNKRIHFISSIISTTLVLYVFAVLGLVVYVSNNLSKHLKEHILLQVILDKNTDAVQQKAVSDYLTQAGFVKSFEFVDSVKAAKDFIAETGQDFIADLGYNPLSSSFDIYLKQEFSDQQHVDVIIQELKKMKSCVDFKYQESLIDQINDTFKSITPVLLGLTLMFFIISIILINNTVRLNIFSQRFLIKSMQYVGATRNFIIKPFLTRSILNGLIAGVLSSLMIFNTAYILLYIMPYLDVVLPDFDKSINLGLLLILTIVLSLAGILLNVSCTWVATRKYLKTKIEELY
ncbi:MAG: hypothetical protein HYZ42_14815 [Bacteroidetes bacterium]|nr:hypothetical protein [Bacteroidota bacterium]